MSFKKHGSKVNVEKARLEHKLYLARENPEPIFEISECALNNVPTGIYSLCKVFRKKELRMEKNRLTSLSGGGMLTDLSLLTILDISDNEFVYIPSEIGCLRLLEELYLHNNHLKNLPNELLDLSNLMILNVSNNKLKYIPEALGNLKSLNVLDISKNKFITKLPKSIGQLENLLNINFDGLSITYPPENVLQNGTVAIISFLAGECGIDCKTRNKFLNEEQKEEFTNISNDRVFNSQCKEANVQVVLMKLETAKERKQNALLEVEKNIKEQQKYELELQSIHKDNRKKLLEDLAIQQSKLEFEIERVQQEREINRTRLLSFIYDAEREADDVIKEFLTTSETERQTQAELLEREKKEQMEILSQSHLNQSTCRTKETLLAMEELLDAELLTEKKIEEYTKFRECNAQSMLTMELRTNDHLASIVRDQKRDRDELLDRLRNDEVLQKAALTALLERSDTRTWSIVQQVSLVQSQLAALTKIEQERKKLEISQQINDLADKRVALSSILVSLLEQQENRRQQLLETIDQIEQQRDINCARRDSLFWLKQYQSLMEARPQGLLEGLEPSLVRHVAIAGALHCLPFLATLPSILPHIDHNHLEAIGIHNENDRQAVILAVENYLAEKKINVETEFPSAPIEEPSTSSTNTHENKTLSSDSTTECVICFDSQCEVIFLPCGHLCCCASCSNMVPIECPMCRGFIELKIQVRKP